MTKNTLEADFAMHMRSITEGELWEIIYTGRDNYRKTGVTDDVITRNNSEYYSHTLAEIMNGKNRNE